MNVLLVAALAAALVLVAGASSASRPSVRVAARHPLTVVGRGFQDNERVTVTAIVKGKHVRKIRASAAGRFRIRFRGVQVKRCLGFIVTARGALASFAIARSPNDCASP